MDCDLNRLLEPFAPELVSWRVGSTTGDKSRGLPLAYIDARDVMDRLDEVAGPGNWQCRYPLADDKRTVCEIGVKVGDEWIWKADGADDTDYEGVKGGLSDAFKRAAVKWGIGRYLYGLKSPWVAIESAGRSFKIAANEMPRLRALLPSPATKQTAAQPAPAPAPAARVQPEQRKTQADRDVPVAERYAADPKYAELIKATPAGPMWKFMRVKEGARAFLNELKGCTDSSEVDGLLEGYGPVLDALALVEPGWWAGMDGFAGLQSLINNKRREIEDADKKFHPRNLVAG